MNKNLKFGLVGMALIMSLLSCNNNSEKSSASQTEASTNQTAEEQHQDHDHDHSAEAAPTSNEAPKEFLPEFNFYQLRSGIKVSKADISSKTNNIFILFDPGCSHCQAEATELEKNIDKLKDVQIFYISMNDPALVLGFFDNFAPKLSKLSNVEVLIDKDQDFIQKIHVPSEFPANYVYGPDGKLKAHWEGDKNTNEAIQAFHQ